MDEFSNDLFEIYDSLPQKRPSLLSQDMPIRRSRFQEPDPTPVSKEYYTVTNTTENCIHECVYPINYTEPIIQKPPRAKFYSFTLDPFQEAAISCLDKKQSVLVAAHTSAGKTAVAEYAIATALRDNQRVIYTSPIKALSNQKYRELNDEFKDVGLMTGDVTINESGKCLVMTTEILRSMLYRGSELIREISWVIFDEVHYMRDIERGVVWEETIILLPAEINLVFLSATISNAKEFAEWICKLKGRPCNVVYTEMRPVPLRHYMFPCGGDGLYLVVDEKGAFREGNFQKAIGSLSQEGGRVVKKVSAGSNSEVVKMVEIVIERDFAPAIIFSFSKKECEAHAISLTKLDFTTEEEKEAIEGIFNNAISTLSEEDRSLPMIGSILSFLKRGIGVHHGGLLPIVKEITEILFQEGLIKTLFSTETFSMGLNMPARTVVFTNVRKYDGKTFRWLAGGEYIQMSGRAGRRGKDSMGVCILMVDQKMEPDVAKGMLKGNMNPLNSAFHLSYNMLLNVMLIEDINPEDLIKKSFHQFQSSRATPQILEERQGLLEKLDEVNCENEEELQEYNNLKGLQEQLKAILRGKVFQNDNIIRYLTPGRLVRVESGTDWGWCVVVNFKVRRGEKPQLSNITEKTQKDIRVTVLTHVLLQEGVTRPCPDYSLEGDLTTMEVDVEFIQDISQIVLNLPSDLRMRENQRRVLGILKEVFRSIQGDYKLVHPVRDMGIEDEGLDTIMMELEGLNQRISELSITQSPNFQEQLANYEELKKLKQAISLLDNQLKASKTMVLADDLKAMKRVLRRLEFSSDEGVELKGRVACHISTSDELLVTEMILSGVLKDLPTPVMVALLSCLVNEDHSKEIKTPNTPELTASYQILVTIATRFAQIFVESKLNIDQQVYVDSYKPSLMEAVFLWANGGSFAEVCEISSTFEGNIIRCIRRLHELLRQMSDATKSIGSYDLSAKFEEGYRSIERGIVFAASLYL